MPCVVAPRISDSFEPSYVIPCQAFWNYERQWLCANAPSTAELVFQLCNGRFLYSNTTGESVLLH